MKTKLSSLAVLVGLTGTAPSLPSAHAQTAEEAEQSHHGPRQAGEPAAPDREETSMHTIRPTQIERRRHKADRWSSERRTR
jgi:hypothetical protein